MVLSVTIIRASCRAANAARMNVSLKIISGENKAERYPKICLYRSRSTSVLWGQNAPDVFSSPRPLHSGGL